MTMRLKIDLEIPNWTKWLVGGVALGIVLGVVGARVHADPVAIKTQFNIGDILSADEMSTNFQKLQAAINANTPTGTVVAFAGATPPTGWLLCDGSAVSHTQYPALFAAIGTIYGGNGISSFNVPDLQAAGIRGVGTSTKFKDNVTISPGQVVNDQFQGHTLGDGASFLMRHPTKYGDNQGVGIGAAIYIDTDNFIKSVAVSDGQNGEPRTGSETTGKAIGMNYIIKY